jgi:hypothetical protein
VEGLKLKQVLVQDDINLLVEEHKRQKELSRNSFASQDGLKPHIDKTNA